jgi:hypothetical protein
MNAETLQQVQDQLNARGARDVKFLFNLSTAGAYPSVVEADIADLMQTYLDGKCEAVADFQQEIAPLK